MIEFQAEFAQDDAQFDKVEPHLGKFRLTGRTQFVIDLHRLAMVFSSLFDSSHTIQDHRRPRVVGCGVHSVCW